MYSRLFIRWIKKNLDSNYNLLNARVCSPKNKNNDTVGHKFRAGKHTETPRALMWEITKASRDPTDQIEQNVNVNVN